MLRHNRKTASVSCLRFWVFNRRPPRTLRNPCHLIVIMRRLYYHLGVARWLAKDQEGGLPELEKAARLSPSVFDYRFRLGSAYLEMGQSEKAVTELQEAVAIDKTQSAAWSALAPGPEQLRRLVALGRASRNGPSSNRRRCSLTIRRMSTAQMNIGYAYLKMGEFNKAERAYRTATANDPKSPAAHYDLAISPPELQDQLESAQRELQEAIRLDPSLAEAHYTLGITYWQSGDFAATDPRDESGPRDPRRLRRGALHAGNCAEANG